MEVVKKYLPQAFVGIPIENFFFRHRDEDKKLFPDEKFPVVIPILRVRLALYAFGLPSLMEKKLDKPPCTLARL
jgi:hypothetical protein